VSLGGGAGARGVPLPAPSDPGLQPERTALAWTRTACSLAVVGLLGLRWSGPFGSAFLLVAGFACLAVLLVLARGRRRFARLGHALHDGAGSRPGALSPGAVAGSPGAGGERGGRRGGGGERGGNSPARPASRSVLAMVSAVALLGATAAVVVAAV
jgi:hypothetical protein